MFFIRTMCGDAYGAKAPQHDRVLFIKNSDNEADATLFLDAV